MAWGENKDGVPTADSSDNDTLMDVIGNKTDTHDGDSLYAMVEMINKRLHTASKVWPTLADAVTLTTTGNDWTDFGTKVEIVAANAIATAFSIDYIDVAAVGDVQQYEIKLWSGGSGEVEIAHRSFSRTAQQSQETAVPCATGILAANTKVMASIASDAANADTADIKIGYHLHA